MRSFCAAAFERKLQAIFHGDDIKVAFTVTESLLNFGLFRLDGGYDLGTDLICTGDSAVVWGRELFGHYRRISKQIEGIRDIEHSGS